MSKLDDILFNPVVLPDDMKKQQIKALMFELLEDQPPSPSIHDYSHDAINEHLAWVRKQVEAL